MDKYLIISSAYFCSSRESIGKCVGPIPGSLTSLKCTDQENQMMQNTLQSTGRALGGLCDGDGKNFNTVFIFQSDYSVLLFQLVKPDFLHKLSSCQC